MIGVPSINISEQCLKNVCLPDEGFNLERCGCSMKIFRCVLKRSPEVRQRFVNNMGIFHLLHPARAQGSCCQLLLPRTSVLTIHLLKKKQLLWNTSKLWWQSINYIVFYLTDCPGSTYNLLLFRLYVKDFSGNILIKLLTDIGPAGQFVRSCLIITKQTSFTADPVMQSLWIPPCCSDHHSSLVWAFIFSGQTKQNSVRQVPRPLLVTC